MMRGLARCAGLVAGATLAVALMPARALADNCGSLKDCYFTAGAALGATLSVIGLGIIAAGLAGLKTIVETPPPAPVETLAADVIAEDVRTYVTERAEKRQEAP